MNTLEESEILFIFSLVEAMKLILLQKDTDKRLVYKILKICFAALTDNKSIVLVTSKQSIVGEDYKEIAWVTEKGMNDYKKFFSTS